MNTVCFDMDGVIVDSERHWVPLENELILPHVVPSGDIDANDITGMNVTDLYVNLSNRFETAISETEFIELYDETAEELYKERVELIDDFHDLLYNLREQGTKLALVSSSPSHWIQFVLDRFMLEEEFDVVVSATDIKGKSKPAPDIYRYAASKLDSAPSQCIAVEDSHHGVEAAIESGMYCLGYQTDVNPDQDLTNADEIIKGEQNLKERLIILCS